MRAKTSIHGCSTALALAFVLTSAPAFAQVVERKTLSLAGARAVADAAAAEARSHWAGGSIAVVDEGGHLLYLLRLDNTFAAAANISIAKARSAANFRRETRVFEDAIKNGRLSLVANPELLPLQGGVPIVIDGQVVGAIGVAGANSAQQDEDIAKAAVLALTSPQGEGSATLGIVEHLPAQVVDAAFAKGRPLIENGEYKIHASRREAPGMAEVHVRDTDIIHVLDGTATLVTGGRLVEPRTTADDEVRGTGIDGGEPRRLVKGDVIVVPHGVPHWFEKVEGTFVYYVVKVPAASGALR